MAESHVPRPGDVRRMDGPIERWQTFDGISWQETPAPYSKSERTSARDQRRESPVPRGPVPHVYVPGHEFQPGVTYCAVDGCHALPEAPWHVAGEPKP